MRLNDMKFKVTIKRIITEYGEAEVDAENCDHAEQIVANDVPLHITKWDDGHTEYDVVNVEGDTP